MIPMTSRLTHADGSFISIHDSTMDAQTAAAMMEPVGVTIHWVRIRPRNELHGWVGAQGHKYTIIEED